MAGGFFTRWDSGSLVLTFPGLQPVGLLFAGNEKENFQSLLRPQVFSRYFVGGLYRIGIAPRLQIYFYYYCCNTWTLLFPLLGSVESAEAMLQFHNHNHLLRRETRTHIM